jgi:lincosamide and streptogramin A transport system ATP-binding/permease protein
MSTIALEALGFHYDSPYAPVFDALDLRIDTSWRTALVGRNGRGKTTLLRLVRGELEPRRGSITMPVAPVALAPSTDGRSESTRAVVRSAVADFASMERRMQALTRRGDAESLERYGVLALEYERLGGWVIDHRISEEWAAMGLAESLLDRPHATLSAGERTRASIVALFLRPDGYPLIDEPTNHLDREGRAVLARYLEGKPGFLLVSHDRALLDRCCDHVVALERDGVWLHAGDYASWRRRRTEEAAHEARRRERLGREVRDLEQASRARRGWSEARERTKRGAADKGFVGHRAARMMKRALHAERRATEKLREKRALVRIPEKRRPLEVIHADGPERLLVAERVAVDVGGRRLVEGLDLVLRRGERLVLEGPNGAGKTLLLETLCAERPPAEGRITPAHGTCWRRVRQVPAWRSGRLADRIREAGLDAVAFRQVLGAMGVAGDVLERPIETLSAGERKKVELCPSFLEPAHVWVWDEPLNHLDIESREQIEAAVLAARPTLLLVEHDAWFTDRVATHRLAVGRAAGAARVRPVRAQASD